MAMSTLPRLPHPQDRPTLTVPEAGAYLGFNRVSSYAAVKNGVIPVLRTGERSMVVPTAALWRLLGMNPDAPRTADTAAA